MAKKILGWSGSLRSSSLNTALLRAAARHLPAGVELILADIGAVPAYNGDLDGDVKPGAVQRLIDEIERTDGMLIATPEYNYSIPGVLKNAIDWVSRPAYKSVLAHKPTGILGASKSPVGTARAQAHLRQILAGTVTPVFPHPEFLVGAAHNKFDGAGVLTDSSTDEHLQRYVAKFVDWIG